MRKPRIVEREPYAGPVVEIKSDKAPEINRHADNPIYHDYHNRQPHSGVRNMQDSSFSLSGKYQFYMCRYFV